MTNTQAQTILELRRRGNTYADIAAHVGSSINTVKSYCLRNEQTLQALIAKEICKHCGAVLPQRPGVKPRSFCCDRCRFTWWSRHRDLMRRRVHTHTCRCCGHEFQSAGRAPRAYCSRRCYYARFQQISFEGESS